MQNHLDGIHTWQKKDSIYITLFSTYQQCLIQLPINSSLLSVKVLYSDRFWTPSNICSDFCLNVSVRHSYSLFYYRLLVLAMSAQIESFNPLIYKVCIHCESTSMSYACSSQPLLFLYVQTVQCISTKVPNLRSIINNHSFANQFTKFIAFL